MKQITVPVRLVVLLVMVLVLGRAPAQQDSADQGAGESRTIADVIEGDFELSTFRSALEEAGLLEALRDEGPMTVFAPTNAAFEKLPPEQLDDLFSNEDALRAFLNYHVIQTDIILSPTGMIVSNGAINPIDTVLMLPESIGEGR